VPTFVNTNDFDVWVVTDEDEGDDVVQGQKRLSPGDTIDVDEDRYFSAPSGVIDADSDAAGEPYENLKAYRELVSGPGPAALEPQEGGGTVTTESAKDSTEKPAQRRSSSKKD